MNALMMMGMMLLASSKAFSHIKINERMAASRSARRPTTSSSLLAIIYGWDGDDVDEDEVSPNHQNTPNYFDSGPSVYDGEQCSTAGVGIAETLSVPNGDHMASLAKLAVAFSPSGHSLTLNDIEYVNVKCVRNDAIELEAMLCETLGCVNLSIPIKFPVVCDDIYYTSTLEGCVMNNIDQLTTQAESTIQMLDDKARSQTNLDMDELCLLNEKVEYPSWWIPPELDYNLSRECTSIRSLLNDEEFESSIIALAQDGLDHTPGNEFVAKKAKVANVGPAGICLKVGATKAAQHQQFGNNNNNDLSFLDVMYPFGLSEPVDNSEKLRAVVLGAIAAAEDKASSSSSSTSFHTY